MVKIRLMQFGFVALAAAVLGSSSIRADVIVLSSGTPAPSLSPILTHDVNFDDVATGTAITSGLYASQGIASITNVGQQLFALGGTQSSPNYLGTGSSDGWAADMTLTFADLQSVVGFGEAGPNSTTLSVFDISHNLLFSSTFASGSNVYWVVTDNTGPNIKSLEIASSFVAFDDIQFNNFTSSVPEPSYVPILGAAMLAFGYVAWRRRTALSE